MAVILKCLQDKYVPQKGIVINGTKHCEIIKPILFGGDQLTEERAINTRRAFLDGETKFEKLKGLSPKFEDWHAKKTLYEVTTVNSW